MKDPRVLEFLEMAKEIYVTWKQECMCLSFDDAYYKLYGEVKYKYNKIPLFDYDVAYSMFGARGCNAGLWFPIDNREIRIRYFDWLIEQEKSK